MFQDEETLKAIVSANDDMEIIAGADDDTKAKYPGAFIAGVLSADALEDSRCEGSSTKCQEAIQKLSLSFYLLVAHIRIHDNRLIRRFSGQD